MWHKLILLALVSSFWGCATKPMLTAMAPAHTHEHSLVQQQWAITHADEQVSVGVVIERSPSNWQWILMNSLGQRIATVTSNGATIDYGYDVSHRARLWVPELVALWQLSYWPLDSLAHAGWRGETVAAGRQWWFSDILRATITYDNADNANSAPLNGTFEIDSHAFRVRVQSQRLK